MNRYEIKEKLPVRNFTTLRTETPGGRAYTVRKNEAGEEVGFALSGLLTRFDSVNENGQQWQSTAYDEGLTNYFEKNDLFVPLDLQHERDIRSLAGRLESLEKTEEGILIEAYVPRGVYYYNLIKTLLDNYILQGFSNYGYVTRGHIADDVLHVEAFQLISASLVDVPADTAARFIRNGTALKGFSPSQEMDTGLPVFWY
ncbi:MAG: hypothetical protein LUE31_08080 [Lachnospiraceae bacterium]|nr:hypothetical protein [Lachnospiraceae bacterium]